LAAECEARATAIQDNATDPADPGSNPV
jgi:hypothetical protein